MGFRIKWREQEIIFYGVEGSQGDLTVLWNDYIAIIKMIGGGEFCVGVLQP